MSTVKDEIKAYFKENPGDAAWITDLFTQGFDIRIYTLDEWKRILDEWWSGWEVFSVLGAYHGNVSDDDGWVVEDHSGVDEYQSTEVMGYDEAGIARFCCRVLDNEDEMVTAILDGKIKIPRALAARLERCRVKGDYQVRSDARKKTSGTKKKPPARSGTASRKAPAKRPAAKTNVRKNSSKRMRK